MRSMILSPLVLILCLLSTSSANAAWEWWHHMNNMPGGYSADLTYGLATCSHTDSSGNFVVTASNVERNIVLATLPGSGAQLSNGTCYAEHTIELDAAASFTKSLSVSASQSSGGSVTVGGGGGYEAGQAAKGHVEGHIEYSKNWDWTVTNTYEESWTGSATTTIKWPESGQKQCTGPGASVTRLAYIMGHRATVTVENRQFHRCTLRYLANSGAQRPGDTVIIGYSGDNTVIATGTSTGVNPIMVMGGPIIETGPIQAGCSSM